MKLTAFSNTKILNLNTLPHIKPTKTLLSFNTLDKLNLTTNTQPLKIKETYARNIMINICDFPCARIPDRGDK